MPQTKASETEPQMAFTAVQAPERTAATDQPEVSARSDTRRFVHLYTLAFFTLAMAYAVVRYHLYKDVPWSQLPLYTVNKAVSLTALALIALSFVAPRRSLGWYSPLAKRYAGLLGYGLAAMHVVMSLALLSPENYAKFFDDGAMLNLNGSLSLFFGVLAFGAFSLAAFCSLQASFLPKPARNLRVIRRCTWIGLGSVAAHLVAMGASGWVDPGHWPGGLVPITMIAFAIGAGALLTKAYLRVFSRAQ